MNMKMKMKIMNIITNMNYLIKNTKMRNIAYHFSHFQIPPLVIERKIFKTIRTCHSLSNKMGNDKKQSDISLNKSNVQLFHQKFVIC